MTTDEKIEINTLIERDNKKDDTVLWESCCIRMNPHALAYIGQLLISIIILVFSFIMLIKADGSCEKSAPFIGLISFLMGKLLSSVVGSSN